jgi:hypothetical protein
MGQYKPARLTVDKQSQEATPSFGKALFVTFVVIAMLAATAYGFDVLTNALSHV